MTTAVKKLWEDLGCTVDFEKKLLSVRAAIVYNLPQEFPAARHKVERVTDITDGCVVPETFRAKTT